MINRIKYSIASKGFILYSKKKKMSIAQRLLKDWWKWERILRRDYKAC